jgi:hypothetical protein
MQVLGVGLLVPFLDRLRYCYRITILVPEIFDNAVTALTLVSRRQILYMFQLVPRYIESVTNRGGPIGPEVIR